MEETNYFGWTSLFLILFAFFVIWMLAKVIKHQPQLFSKENLSKSFSTMGFLALMLILFIGFCVLFLKYT